MFLVHPGSMVVVLRDPWPSVTPVRLASVGQDQWTASRCIQAPDNARPIFAGVGRGGRQRSGEDAGVAHGGRPLLERDAILSPPQAVL